MRRILTFAFLSLIYLSTFAQSSTGFAQKTRYIYLWDVTYSTVDWGNREMCDNISSFLIKDIAIKQNSDAEIIIVPFNDKVVERNIIRHKASDFNSIYVNERESLREKGYNWATAHTIDGHTNVAGALTYAREEYACDTDYNNIIILLTDGYNEYTKNGDTVKSSSEEAKEFLRNEIEKLDKEITEHVDKGEYLSMFLYVMFKDRKKNGEYKYDDPRGENREHLCSVSNTRFIAPSESSINLHFIELGAEIKLAEGSGNHHMNLRESKFSIELTGKQGDFDILRRTGKRLQFKVLSNNRVLLDLNQPCKIDYSGRSITVENVRINDKEVTGDCEIPISIELVNSEEFENCTDDYIKVWLKTKNLVLKVTKNFKPKITIRAKE